MSPPRGPLGPLLTGAGAAVAFVAALLAFLLVDTDSKPAAAQTFTSDESAAVAAAQTEVANVSSFRRAHFEADFQRALRGLTGQIATQFKQNRAVYLKTITDGKFDLVAKVLHTALVGPVDDDSVHGYVVLVSFNGYRSDQLNVPTAQQNMQVTVVKKGDRWLIADLENVGVSNTSSGSASPAPSSGASSSPSRPSSRASSGR